MTKRLLGMVYFAAGVMLWIIGQAANLMAFLCDGLATLCRTAWETLMDRHSDH